MTKKLDLTGQRFGRLVAMSRDDARKPARWICRCDCGNTKIVYQTHIIRGNSKSCGCLNSDVTTHRNLVDNPSFKHGLWKTSEFKIWSGMLARCHNSTDKDFGNYGGRGISVCDEWRNDFQAFFLYVGPRPSKEHSIDRIDNNGNYAPGNVRWATKEEQKANRRCTVILEVNGNQMLLPDAAKAIGINPQTLRGRINRGVRGSQLVSQTRPYKRRLAATNDL